ncbi:hypothetical protein GCM10010277_07790 [Streptomyces longisporoflavus]|uniref:hypothetical protein n=1 Tax=Streptomyces longisporoflavus TaxID=28044 RepID=UPI00167C860E|nr:hypothetical protein [Streptomyces longisporoflavus]GGV26288.1 hypothetical protein GCM10010277_07790 [Streptomyces longisporoflavus]
MRKAGFAALEAVGMATTALAAQAVIRGLLDHDTELLWGLADRVPGGRTGQMVLLGFIALLAAVSGGWAHTRREAHAPHRGDAQGPGAGRRPEPLRDDGLAPRR